MDDREVFCADKTSLRPFSCREDFESMIDYFHRADDAFLIGMGVDRQKLPSKDAWLQRLMPDLERAAPDKQTYYLRWQYDGRGIGHSNINKIKYGDEGYVHLHIWTPEFRKSGLGAGLFKQSVNTYFQTFQLKRVVCEPCADNPAPNKVLRKMGFRFIKRYLTVPGLINLEQEVNRYEIDHPI